MTVLILGALVGACGPDPTTTFGPPNGIAGRTPPEPTATATSAPTSTGAPPPPAPSGHDAAAPPPMPMPMPTGGMDSGSPPPAADSGGGPVAPACAVSWSSGVYPLFQSTGPGQCASAQCHGGSSSPTISDGDAAGTYSTLAAFILNGHTYLAGGDSNPADSAIECNLGIVQPACGALAMPAAPGSLSAANLQTIDTWVRCGAPQN